MYIAVDAIYFDNTTLIRAMRDRDLQKQQRCFNTKITQLILLRAIKE